ncbi:D-sedoheptulose 7-phosphate isomerase [Roseococcus sp. DSY-14]|uniref:D-sedoheptulose 7-phosphate isomerase n=1 Tax=Roseococcus sp. DSY-14 TaxID=3369650 RepID=UPI00387B3B48
MPTETRDYLARSAEVLDRMRDDAALHAAIAAAVALCEAALRRGGKILFCGNGGSAADAQHLAAELVSRFMHDRPGMAALALTVDSSALTGIGNDYGFERLFARQVEALGRAGDVLVGISTSGRSPNVVEAMRAARARGLGTVALTGRDGGAMAALADAEMRIPSDSTPLIQQGQLAAGHLLCLRLEEALHPAP